MEEENSRSSLEEMEEGNSKRLDEGDEDNQGEKFEKNDEQMRGSDNNSSDCTAEKTCTEERGESRASHSETLTSVQMPESDFQSDFKESEELLSGTSTIPSFVLRVMVLFLVSVFSVLDGVKDCCTRVTLV